MSRALGTIELSNEQRAVVAQTFFEGETLWGRKKTLEGKTETYSRVSFFQNETRAASRALSREAGAKWTLPALASSPSSPSSLSGVRRNAYLFDPHGGSCVIDGRVVATRHRVTLRCDAAVAFEATGERVGVLVLQGRDIGEPVTQHGPFVGNTRQDIMQAFQDYQRTGFGRLHRRSTKARQYIRLLLGGEE